ncbi:MAG: helix-turn-helix domain-containing protein [Sphingomonas sp.]
MPETRPSTYKPAFARRAHEKCAHGFTDRELAAEFGVSRTTIFRWRAAHPEFAEATALGKAKANERVERALYERAIGYEEEAVRIFLPDGAAAPVILRYSREVRADVRAALQWLRARDPKTWARTGPPEDAGGIVERLRKAMDRVGDRQVPYEED